MPKQGDKTSIIFAVAHEAGELYGVLRLFAEAKINLTRISSMPLRSDPSNYSFFLDFEGSQGDAKVAEVLGQNGDNDHFVEEPGQLSGSEGRRYRMISFEF